MILTSKKARKCRRKKRERNDKVSRQLSDIARKLSFFHPHSEHCAINGNVLSHRYTFSLVLLPSIFNCNENINELKTIRMIPLTLYILWKKSDQSKKLSIWIKITVTSLTFICKKSENQVNFTWTDILKQIQHVKPCFNVGEHPLINILFLMSKDKGIWNRKKCGFFSLRCSNCVYISKQNYFHSVNISSERRKNGTEYIEYSLMEWMFRKWGLCDFMPARAHFRPKIIFQARNIPYLKHLKCHTVQAISVKIKNGQTLFPFPISNELVYRSLN